MADYTCRHKPDVLIICGSGLSNLSDDIEDQEIVEYANCPGFPVSAVQGHGKRLVFGKLGGKVCLIALMEVGAQYLLGKVWLIAIM